MCSKGRGNISPLIYYLLLLLIICSCIGHGKTNQRSFKPLQNYVVNDENVISHHPLSILLKVIKPKVILHIPVEKYSIDKNQHQENKYYNHLSTKESCEQRKSFNHRYLNTYSEENIRRKSWHGNSPVNVSITDPWKPRDPMPCPVTLRSLGLYKQKELEPSVNAGMTDTNPDINYTIPPNVCGLCPAKPNDLYPCSCVGNAGNNAGSISISCNSSTNWTTMGELKYTLNNADFITKDVVRFNMSGTNVSGVLDNSVWGNLSIKQIIMNHNQIRDIDNHAFNSSRDSLYFLSLENNAISFFFWDLLSEVPSLGTLMLKSNQIKIIQSGAFPEMTQLSNLDLSNNQIDYLGENAFSKLHKLTYLKLNNNKLSELNDNVFTIINHAPSSSVILNISSNQISLLKDQVFSGIKPNQIDLTNNMLISVKQSIFEPLIVDTGVFIQILLKGNPILCNCDILWILTAPPPVSRFLFDDFHCADKDVTLYKLTIEDLNCTQSILSTRTY